MKMLGQDVVTKTEFDVFKLEEFEPVANSISNRASMEEVSSLKSELETIKKTNKKMMVATVGVAVIAVVSFILSVFPVL